MPKTKSDAAALEAETRHSLAEFPGAVKKLCDAAALTQIVSKALSAEARRTQTWRHRKTG